MFGFDRFMTYTSKKRTICCYFIIPINIYELKVTNDAISLWEVGRSERISNKTKGESAGLSNRLSGASAWMLGLVATFQCHSIRRCQGQERSRAWVKAQRCRWPREQRAVEAERCRKEIRASMVWGCWWLTEQNTCRRLKLQVQEPSLDSGLLMA